VLYERIKHIAQKYNHEHYKTPINAPLGAVQNLVIASLAKFIASLATYPHEVNNKRHKTNTQRSQINKQTNKFRTHNNEFCIVIEDDELY
jgi:hypothetical protein